MITNRDILFLGLFAIIAMGVQRVHAPEWVELVMLAIGGLYIVFTSPKVNDKANEAEDEKGSTLDRALAETEKQLKLKGVEKLDEHFKKHPYKMPKRFKSRKKRK